MAEGHDFAGVAAEEPVNADESLFRIGSVSKSTTGTAVVGSRPVGSPSTRRSTRRRRAVETDPPTRVCPPGEFASHSNYGVGLAGYAASTAAGTDDATHVREAVFEPLGTDRGVAAQPPGGELGEAVPRGHVATGGGFRERGLEITGPGTARSRTHDLDSFAPVSGQGGAGSRARTGESGSSTPGTVPRFGCLSGDRETGASPRPQTGVERHLVRLSR